MPRTDNDSWDLASSVGVDRDDGRRQRVLSNREGLIYDPYAEPLVRAVGLDFFVRALDGEIDLDESTLGSTCAARRREWQSAHAISTRCSPMRPRAECVRP